MLTLGNHGDTQNHILDWVLSQVGRFGLRSPDPCLRVGKPDARLADLFWEAPLHVCMWVSLTHGWLIRLGKPRSMSVHGWAGARLADLFWEAPLHVCAWVTLSCCSPFRPTTMASLLKVEDVPAEKAERYGTEFLNFITKFCAENKMESDVMPDDAEVSARVSSWSYHLVCLQL